MFSHLPTTLTIAGAGAGMAGLVEHAHDGRTPTALSWLIASAVAGLLALGLVALLSATWWVAFLRPLSDARRAS